MNKVPDRSLFFKKGRAGGPSPEGGAWDFFINPLLPNPNTQQCFVNASGPAEAQQSVNSSWGDCGGGGELLGEATGAQPRAFPGVLSTGPPLLLFLWDRTGLREPAASKSLEQVVPPVGGCWRRF